MADRISQIAMCAHRVEPAGVGAWRSTSRTSPSTSVVVAPADLAWLIEKARVTEKAEAEIAEWKRIATGFEALLNRYKRDNRIGTQVSDALLRVRELAAKMKSESGQSWNSVSGQRILNALTGESNG